MNKPSLGLKLTIRKYKSICISAIKKMSLNSMITILVAIWGIYLTYQSIQISATALNLSKQDTTQQAQIKNQQKQIGKLQEIILDIRAQDSLAQQQIKQLVSLSKETNGINRLTNRLLKNSISQSKTLNRQLTLSLKSDSLKLTEISNITEGDYHKLYNLFDKIQAIRLGNICDWQMLSDPKAEFPEIAKLKDLLADGFDNKILLKDTTISATWYSLYKQVKDFQVEKDWFGDNPRLFFGGMMGEKAGLCAKFIDFKLTVQSRLLSQKYRIPYSWRVSAPDIVRQISILIHILIM